METELDYGGVEQGVYVWERESGCVEFLEVGADQVLPGIPSPVV